jgi:hypothetical protein
MDKLSKELYALNKELETQCEKNKKLSRDTDLDDNDRRLAQD